jgi:excisionase family DNA binding protein
MTENDQLSTKEAAQLAGVSQRHIRRLLNDGTIEGRRLGQWVWLVDRQSLQKWVESRKKE